MAQPSVIAVSVCSSAESLDLPHIAECVLDGAREAGFATEHFLLADPAEGDFPVSEAYSGIVTSLDAARSLVRHLTGAQHLVLGLAGGSRRGDSPISSLSRACYDTAKWTSLGQLIDAGEVEIAVAPSADPGQFRFPVSWRPLVEEHKGLSILHPPREIPDHDDPFCENAFFLLEELQRLLGFMPSGRILSTGLFDPPLDQNPMLKRQAFELGRHLAVEPLSMGVRK